MRPNLIGLLIAVVAVLIVLSASARVAAPADQRKADFSAALACGAERWKVKTLQDRPKLLPLRDTTIVYLISRPRPSRLPATRLTFERHVFRISAIVSHVFEEPDSDLHIVLGEGGLTRHMIAEAPSSACITRATPTRRRQMSEARKAVRPCDQAVVTGVALFEFKNGQTGVAPNAIELHPILGFRCLSASPPPPPPPAPSPAQATR